MPAATSLLNFILNPLKDPLAQEQFRACPEQVLAAHGLTGVSAADSRDTLPLVTDRRARTTGTCTMLTAASVMPRAGTAIAARTPGTASMTLRSRRHIWTCTESVTAAGINYPAGTAATRNLPNSTTKWHAA
jgi:hypothetical protein